MRYHIFVLLFLFILTHSNPQTLLCQTANHVVISEVYGGGGNSKAPYKNDFIELYNPTSSPVDLSGWSVQYASAAASKWNVTRLNGSIAAHGFYLIQEASGGHDTTTLPAPDVSDSINISVSAGKIVLCDTMTACTDTNPTGIRIIDKIGYGNANGYEGSAAAPSPSSGNIKSIERKALIGSTASSLGTGGADASCGNGFDSDNNSSDFIVQSIMSPQNSSSSLEMLTVDYIKGHSMVSPQANTIPRLQNYPNPFNPSTVFEITLPMDGAAALSIFNLMGQKIATITKGMLKAGRQQFTFEAKNLASGTYIARLEFGNQQVVRRILLMK